MGKRKIDIETLRLLYALSGNYCAFTGCHSPIFEDDGTLTGECCHIEAFSPKGPRYNCHQSDEERNGYDNLVLMCARHHKIIDKAYKKYTVETLKEMKRSHEGQFFAKYLKATDMMLHQLQHDSEKYWKDLKLKDIEDKTGLKIELGEQDISSIIEEIDDTYKELCSIIRFIQNSYEHLETDMKVECDKCGIDYSLFDKIPYYENSLKNRNWEMVNIGLPNVLRKLELRYLQLCVMQLEKNVKFEKTKCNMELLNMYKRKLEMVHKDAYYID
jgi:hypothetical protein